MGRPLEVIARLRASAQAYQRFVSEVLDREDGLKPPVLEENIDAESSSTDGTINFDGMEGSE